MNCKDRERYRDLLQASTSIIDMASSSQTVVDALQDMKDMCAEQSVLKTPMHARSNAEAGLLTTVRVNMI
jgi:conserved oligomeric Golgi complex subunit 1